MLFGGVYGTVLTSALLGALQRQGSCCTPLYDACWILFTLAAAPWRTPTRTTYPRASRRAAPTAGAGSPRPGPANGRSSSPACRRWRNTVVLFVWGGFAAHRAGYRRQTVLLIGAGDAAVGLLIVLANAVIM